MGEGANMPRSPDGDTFLLLQPFMWKELGLRGNELLVFARVHGFCKCGGTFYESRARTADYLGISERSVIRSIGSLTEKGLIVEVGRDGPPDPLSTRRYVVPEHLLANRMQHARDNLSPPEELACQQAAEGDELAPSRVTDWHLKRKPNSKYE